MTKTCKVCGKPREMLSWEDTCYTCTENLHYAELKEKILSGEETETSCEDEIVCPWCGERLDCSDDYDLLCEGTHDLECYGCGRPFEVYTNVSYSYDTKRTEELSE